MSAYAMLSFESLPMLPKSPVSSSPELLTKKVKEKSILQRECTTSYSKSSFSSPDAFSSSLNAENIKPSNDTDLSPTARTNTLRNNVQDESKNDLGIAVTSVNLDRKRFIAINSHSFNVKRPGSLDQWEAVEYELSISFNGKQYTAKRSFPRILRLRRELVKELHTRRNNYSGHFGVIRSFMAHPADSYDQNYKCHKDSDATLIPELPSGLCSDETPNERLGIAGRSLNMIQSSVTGNSPRLEEWLKLVFQRVKPETSPSLTSFLSEPVEPKVPLPRIFPRARRLLRRSYRNSISTLSSISEDDVLDEMDRVNTETEFEVKEELSDNEDDGGEELDDDDDSFSECDAFDHQ